MNEQEQHALALGGVAEDADGVRRLEAIDTLQPGYYWRAAKPFVVQPEGWGNAVTIVKGDVHLLLEVIDFDGAAHSVKLLGHPRDGGKTEHVILMQDFLSHFEPAADGEQVRAREQAEVLAEVTQIQQTMLSAQENPLALPAVQEAVTEAVQAFEQEAVATAQREEQDQRKRSQDIGRVLRRAARRSAAAGNPLTVRNTTISDNVEVMLSGGIDTEGLKDLTLEARRRAVIASATATWLTSQTKEITHKLESLAPYYAEQGRVALARASKTIRYVKSIEEGLTSLKLYTGDGVDVMTIVQGASAPSTEPLTLVQGKKFVDEEFAVWADVGESFDFRSVPRFFEALGTNQSLLDQVFPSSRCVVAMAATRRDVEYSEKDPLRAAMNAIANKQVFLLVRDGASVHAVYSSEPSHEALPRLFPSKGEVDGIFSGVDGSRIGLGQVAFVKAMQRHELMRVSYLRLLVLLCGLDHRLKLMGDFYPPQEGLSFMQLAFQQRYFRFLRDDEEERLIEAAQQPVREWMDQCNSAVQSGSRIVAIPDAIRKHSPLLKRSYRLHVDTAAMPPVLIAARQGKRHFLIVPIRDQWDSGGEKISSTSVWLDAEEDSPSHWFLCIDKVRLEDLQRYIYSRRSRVADISWLRAFKRAATVLEADLQQEQPLRHYLRETALSNGVCTPESVNDAVHEAIATWRASHRGAAAPALHEDKEVSALLSLMYPTDRLAEASQEQLDHLVQALGTQPLQLVRTGKNKLALYVEASEADRQPYGTGMGWGWVKRVALESGRGRLKAGTSRLVWLQKGKPDASEQPVREWPQLPAWLHDHPEPCTLGELAFAHERLQIEAQRFAPILAGGRQGHQCAVLPEELHQQLLSSARPVYRDHLRYFDTVWVTIPVALGRNKPGAPSRYAYAAMSYPGFVYRYGSPEQWEQVKSRCLSYFSRMDDHEQREGMARWQLFVSEQPLTDLVVSPKVKLKRPAWATISSHKRGKGTVEGAMLSFSRALDILKGRDPIGRRTFYRNVKDRLSWVSSFDEKAGEKRKAIRREVWMSQIPPWELSPLAWDEQQGRSMANKFFGVTAAPAESERSVEACLQRPERQRA